MTTKEALEQLNALRIANGEKPYKAWKESRAKLDAKLAQYTPQHNVTPALVEVAETPAADVPAKPAVKKLEAPVGNALTVTLADIARELNLNPKIARAKMRRIRVPEGAEKAKHVYNIDFKQTIIDMLKKDFRRKS